MSRQSTFQNHIMTNNFKSRHRRRSLPWMICHLTWPMRQLRLRMTSWMAIWSNPRKNRKGRVLAVHRRHLRFGCGRKIHGKAKLCWRHVWSLKNWSCGNWIYNNIFQQTCFYPLVIISQGLNWQWRLTKEATSTTLSGHVDANMAFLQWDWNDLHCLQTC